MPAVGISPVFGGAIASALGQGVGGDGPIVNTLAFSTSGVLLAGPCSVKAVRCTIGSAVGLTIYDDAFGPAGTQIFNAAMNAGDVTSYSPLREILNGLYVSIGTELVVNGSFDADASSWTAQLTGTSLSQSAGQLVITAGSGGGRATQTISGLTIGHTYNFSVNFISISGGPTAGHRLTTDTAGASTGQVGTPTSGLSTGQTITDTFVAAATSITVALLSGANGIAKFDNVSLKDAAGVTGSFEVDIQS